MVHSPFLSSEGESGSVAMHGVSRAFLALHPKVGDIFEIECHIAHRDKTQGIMRFFMKLEKHLSGDNYSVSILTHTFPFDRVNDLPHHIGVSGGWVVLGLSDGRLLPIVSIKKDDTTSTLKISIIRWKAKISDILLSEGYERPDIGDELLFMRGFGGVFGLKVYAVSDREIYIEDARGRYALLGWKRGEKRLKDEIVSLYPVEAELPIDLNEGTSYIEPLACQFRGIKKQKK